MTSRNRYADSRRALGGKKRGEMDGDVGHLYGTKLNMPLDGIADRALSSGRRPTLVLFRAQPQTREWIRTCSVQPSRLCQLRIVVQTPTRKTTRSVPEHFHRDAEGKTTSLWVKLFTWEGGVATQMLAESLDLDALA